MGGSAIYRLAKKIANARERGASEDEIAELERKRQEALAEEKALRGVNEVNPNMTEKEILALAKKRNEGARKVWENAPKTAVPATFEQYSTVEKEVASIKREIESAKIKENEVKTVYDTYKNALESSEDVELMVRNITRANNRDFNATMNNLRTALKEGIISKEEFDKEGRQINAIAAGRKLALESIRNGWYAKRGLPKPKTGLTILKWESKMIDDLEKRR